MVHSLSFVVEDGTGLINATSLCTYEFARQRWFDLGRGDFADTGDHVMGQQTALIRGSRWLSDSFPWQGYLRNPRTDSSDGQALAWPRFAVIDKFAQPRGNYADFNYGTYLGYGYTVADDAVPREVQWALCEAAWYEYQNPHALQPIWLAADQIKSLRAGPVAIEYTTGKLVPQDSRPFLLSVVDLIDRFLDDTSGSRMFGQTVRG